MEDIRVEHSPIAKDFFVVVKGVKFSAENISTPFIMFWLNKDQADRLAFQINSAIQDQELTDLKSGEELREMSKEDLEKVE